MPPDDIRAFFAVELPEAVRRAAAEVVGVLRGRPGARQVRWVRPENLHVTLRFLGNVAPADVAALAAAAAREARGRAPFTLSVGAAHGFPPGRRPRVVALALEPEAPLAALAADLERAAAARGFEPEERPFRAHVTLGRLRSSGGRAVRGIDALVRGDPAPACEPFEVRDFVLMQSRLGAGGSRYTPLERIALGGDHRPGSPESETSQAVSREE